MCCVSPKSDAGHPFKSRRGGSACIGGQRHAGEACSAQRAGRHLLSVRRMKNITAIRGTHASIGIRFVAGAGIELALTRGWSSKNEYPSFDRGVRPYWITGPRSRIETSFARVGANERI
jgi:hypothetical protein